MTGGLACWIRRVCADQDGTGVGALSKGLSSKAVDADKSQKSAETHESAAEVRTYATGCQLAALPQRREDSGRGV